MNFLRAFLVLLAALVVQAGLGHLWPSSHRFIDVLLVPVGLYGVSGTQRYRSKRLRQAIAQSCRQILLTPPRGFRLDFGSGPAA